MRRRVLVLIVVFVLGLSSGASALTASMGINSTAVNAVYGGNNNWTLTYHTNVVPGTNLQLTSLIWSEVMGNVPRNLPGSVLALSYNIESAYVGTLSPHVNSISGVITGQSVQFISSGSLTSGGVITDPVAISLISSRLGVDGMLTMTLTGVPAGADFSRSSISASATVSPSPEPATMLLMGAGLAALPLIRRLK